MHDLKTATARAVDSYASLQFALPFSFSTIKKISMHGVREEGVFYIRRMKLSVALAVFEKFVTE